MGSLANIHTLVSFVCIAAVVFGKDLSVFMVNFSVGKLFL